jgi:NAD(P)-dependent dehydrogenase (short-subunit alcohol dehydrogenase family)
MTRTGAPPPKGPRVWVVTGASRGFGLAQVARELDLWRTLALSTAHDAAEDRGAAGVPA